MRPHRTATTVYSDKQEKHLTRIHDNRQIRSSKRLYMTATPKIYALNPKQKRKAEHENILVYSMNNQELFGEEIYNLTFKKAIELDRLSDYRVVVFEYNPDFYALSKEERENLKEIKLEESYHAKLSACYSAINKRGFRKYLSDPSSGSTKDQQLMKRLVAFCPPSRRSAKIKQAEMMAHYWDNLKVINKQSEDDIQVIRVKSVSGDMNVKERERNMEWLKSDQIPKEEARILTNVRCLSEGVDVPALDGIIYLSPRSSEIDIVQSIGRVMRKAEGKKHGYIIIPVEVNKQQKLNPQLKESSYKIVWRVLNALKSHDGRLETAVSSLASRVKSNLDSIYSGTDSVESITEVPDSGQGR